MDGFDEWVLRKPTSLTHIRGASFLPTLDENPEWRRKYDAGELEDGLAGLFGCMMTTWPDAMPTPEEAAWIKESQQHCSMRYLASIVLFDDNQIHGAHLIEAADRALSEGTRPTV